MQPPNGVRGYSDFFTSGLRAVTTRHSSSSIEHVPNHSPAPSTSRRSIHDGTRTRARPSSLTISSTSSRVQEKLRGHRSSFLIFSTRLFDRRPRLTREGSSSFSSKSSSFSSISRKFFSDDDLPEVWVETGGPHTPSAPNGRSAQHQTIDPFSSSPDASSMFMDMSSDSCSSISPPVSGPPNIRESFLSLTSSSSTLSSFIISSRRERPTSIQTIPISNIPSLSNSRRSSLNINMQYRPLSQEKAELFWSLEEEPEQSILEHDVQNDWDAAAKTDWHQFHIDILTD